MREQALGFCQSFGGMGETPKAVVRNGLDADALYKIGRRKAAAHAGPSTGGKNVVAAADVVAERLRAPWAEKDRASGGDFFEQGIRSVRKAQVLRGETIAKIASGIERRGQQNRARFSDGEVRGIASGKLRQLRVNFFLDGAGELEARRYEKTSSVGSVLGLGEKIGGDPFCVASFRENDGLRGARGKIDGAIAADDLFGGGDEAVAGAKDFINARNGFRAVREGGNGLRAANAGEACDAEESGGREKIGVGLWTDNGDVSDASDLGRNDSHEERRDESEAATGNVAADRINGAHQLRDGDARLDGDGRRARQLLFGDAANILFCVADGAEKLHADLLAGGVDFALGNPNAGAAKVNAIESFGVGKERGIAALANLGDDLCGDGFGFANAFVADAEQFFFDCRNEFQDAHQRTILFKGYSTMPWALAAFNFGRIWRTTASSTMVLMATHSGSLSAEIVGFFSAGKTPRTAERSSRWTLRRSPTLLVAAIAPCSMRMRLSAFSCFAGSAAAARSMINTVEDSRTVSMTRRRLARREEPVSVTSTMASASCGTFTSVAPQENSTRALTPFRAR